MKKFICTFAMLAIVSSAAFAQKETKMAPKSEAKTEKKVAPKKTMPHTMAKKDAGSAKKDATPAPAPATR